ncbi:hypothetical protein Tco_1476205, partial [Tanacetum coccineum]
SLGVDGLPMMPEDPYAYVVAAFQAPPSPDYVPGPEEPEQAPPLPKFVPEPVYPKFMPPKDEVFPAEEQPLPAVVSLTTDSPGYFADSDPEEDEEDPEEDPTDYPADGGDEDDDDDELFDDDEDDDDDVEEDKDKEEEEANDSFGLTLSPQPHSEADIARLLAIPSHPPSPLSSWSSPLPQIPSPPLPVSPPLIVSPPPLPTSTCCPIHLHPSILIQRHHHGTPPTPTEIPLPTPSPPLLLPSTDHKERKHAEVSYPHERGDTELRLMYSTGQRITNFVTTVRQDTYEIYVRLDDAQDDRSLMSGQLNMLFRDRRAHTYTALCMEREARLSHKAWGRSMDASDTARFEVRALRTTVFAHRQRLQLVSSRTNAQTRQTCVDTKTYEYTADQGGKHWQGQQGTRYASSTSQRYQRRPVAVRRFGYVVAILY